ncbi:MAG TPA: SDR family NAD(P)-dependent oxidoreductase, partial [Kofleriaceae bacterium]
APRAASDGDAPPSYVLACGGRIATTGTGVDAFEPGGHVVAFATAAFGAHVAAASSAAALVRERGLIPALVAAAPPYVAAHLALFGSAVLTRGERIVVRATKQGIGVAAAAWARLRGAEVYVACAGADTASIIAAGGHPLAAGTTAELVGEVGRLTAGRGVDIVLDEADDADLLEEAPKLLRQRGRFVHVSLGGPRIQARIPQGSRDLVFAFTSLATSIRENPSELGPILRELVARVEAGDLLLPVPAVASLAAVEAAGDAASGGWTVVRLDEPGATVAARFRGAIRGDASYLITGGLGGLGLSVAAWMVARGARNLVLVGRRGATSDAQRAALAELERAGARVLVASADVCSRRDVDDLVRRIERELPPLRGVIHAAGLVPKIRPFVELELADLTEVLGPKVVGTWHVHEATRAATLDFFVLYSSISAWIGSKEFASYPAANAFLDAFGHYRRGQGVAGTSIAWGPFAEAGMALPFAERWERVVGLRSMALTEGVEILEQILRADVTDVCAVRLDVARVVEALPAFKTSKLWSDVVEGATAGKRTRSQQAGELVAALRAAAPDARLGLVEQFVQQQVATVLRAEADEIKPNRSLRTQGMDSLTWLELRQRVESALEVTLPVELFMKDPTPSSLAAELHARSSAR